MGDKIAFSLIRFINMTRPFLIAVVLLISLVASGQKKQAGVPPILTKKELEREATNHKCVRKENKSFSVRLKNYPFNLAAQIQFVSFKGTIDTSEYHDLKMNDSLPRLNDTVCYSKLEEVKTITFSQADELTDILYNYGYAGQTSLGSFADCYLPRNAILFLNPQGKVFEFIEVCFECRKTEVSSKNISLGQMCDQKISMLKDLFRTVGIEYGVKER